MAHFAQIIDRTVAQVIVVNNNEFSGRLIAKKNCEEWDNS
jgi:hypothetical protein